MQAGGWMDRCTDKWTDGKDGFVTTRPRLKIKNQSCGDIDDDLKNQNEK